MSVTLTTSDEITVVSIVVTLGTTAWAIYERRQSKSAKDETRRFRHLLLKQQISQQFADVPKRAMSLFRHMRDKQWDRGAEKALLLSSDLASLDGAQSDLIGDSNKDLLATALSMMGDINRHIPRDGLPPALDIEALLMDRCNVILVTANSIERSLRIKAALGGDEDGQ